MSRARAGEPFAVKTRDGLSLSARCYGDPSAPAIVLVHGLNQSRLSWDRQLPLAGHFRLVTFDLRGHGDSDKPDDLAGYASNDLWADDLAAVIAASKVRRPVLVGWSMGGLIVGHYLRRFGTGDVAGVNLVDAVTSFDPRYRTPASDDAGRRLASPDLAVRSAAIADFLRLTFAQAPDSAELAPMLAYNGMVPRALHRGLAGLSTEGIDTALARAPALLATHGGRDALVRVEMSTRLRAIHPRARLSLYPDAGHSPFREDVARFNAELAAFADQTLLRRTPA